MNFFLQITELLFPSRFPVSSIENIPKAHVTGYIDIYALYDYRSRDGKSLIYDIKRYQNTIRDRIVAEKITEIIKQKNLLKEHTYITTVPLTKISKKKRGFNQCERIAKIIAKEMNIPYREILTKKETNHKQSLSYSKKERFKNIQGSFGIHTKEPLNNVNILIVDDIVTTGATLKEIQKTLYAAGVKSCAAITIAH